MMIELGDADLLERLRNTEDAFVERKGFSDSKDWLKTLLAFANSTPVDYPAVLFIGARDDGTPEGGTTNLDSIQKSLSKKANYAYPSIYYATKVLEVDGMQVLAVIIPGSASRPHFAGPSYIREGSSSKIASKEQFERLIAERNSKTYEILKWKDNSIRVDLMNPSEAAIRTGAVAGTSAEIVRDCNQFYVTLEGQGFQRCVPLERIAISFDQGNNRLKLEVRRV